MRFLLPLSFIFLIGCATLFGTPAIPATYQPDGSIDSGTKEATPGLVQEAAGVATAAGEAGIPGATIIAGILTIIGAIGAGIQSWRLKGKVKASDVVQLIDECKTEEDDEVDAGDVAATFKSGTKFNKVLKKAYVKARK